MMMQKVVRTAVIYFLWLHVLGIATVIMMGYVLAGDAAWDWMLPLAIGIAAAGGIFLRLCGRPQQWRFKFFEQEPGPGPVFGAMLAAFGTVLLSYALGVFVSTFVTLESGHNFLHRVFGIQIRYVTDTVYLGFFALPAMIVGVAALYWSMKEPEEQERIHR